MKKLKGFYPVMFVLLSNQHNILVIDYITTMSNISIHTLPDATVEILGDFLDTQSKTSTPYTFLYVSLGSKHNDPRQHFHWPTTQILETNADYQMVPQFLRFPGPDTLDNPGILDSPRVLNIVVDQFSQETMDQNRKILEGLDTDIPMDMLLVDYTFTKNSLGPLMDALLVFAEEHSISPQNCMFCNYIRFSHPNQQEVALEEFVHEFVQSRVDYLFDGKYSDCFYQWYGPQIYLYHCLYPCKRYDTINLFHSPIILHVLHRAYDSIPFTKNMMSSIQASLKTDTERHAWNLFCCNIVDITAM